MFSFHRAVLLFIVALVLLFSSVLAESARQASVKTTAKPTSKTASYSTSCSTIKTASHTSIHSTLKSTKVTSKSISKSTSKTTSKSTTKSTKTTSTTTSLAPTSTPNTICSPTELAVGYTDFCVYGHCDDPVGQLWDHTCDGLAYATEYNAESNDYCFVNWSNGASVVCIDTGSEYLPVNISVLSVEGQTEKYGNCRDVDVEGACGGDYVAEDGSNTATQVNFCCERVG